MSQRSGGVSTKSREHEQDVEFHPLHAEELLFYLKPHYGHIDKPDVLDACSGSGVLGNVFENNNLIDVSSIAYAEIKDRVDILKIRDKFDIIVCNPPLKLTVAFPIYRHLVFSLLKPKGVLLFIINNVFCYQGSDRAEELLYQKYYFLPRWTFKSAGRPLLDCGVMVYHENTIVPKEAAKLRPYVPLTRI